jgi:hypothetical protein
MRTIALALAAAAMTCIIAPAFSASAPSFAKCEALSEQRGAGQLAGAANHQKFMAECLSGQISDVAAVPTRARRAVTQSFEKCEALAEQRGAGQGVGARNHQHFMDDCMSGQIPFTAPTASAPTAVGPAKTYDQCEELANQRAAVAGAANHRKFVSDCMRGRVRS